MPSLEVEISPFMWSRLVERARLDEVGVEDLVRHAVAYYFADLDSGRMAARPIEPALDRADRERSSGVRGDRDTTGST